MCLAKAYVGAAAAGDTGTKLLMENVTRVVIEGDQVRLTSLLGESEELSGRVASIDFIEGRLRLETAEA